MVVSTGLVAWFTAPLGITAVAIGMAGCQFVLLLAGQFFLLRRLIGVPMRESFADGAAALVCSAVLVASMLPLAHALRPALDAFTITALIGSLGLAVYAVCLRFVSPSAWGDLRTLAVRVLGARRLRPRTRGTASSPATAER
jgi:hypothetical protein